MCVTMKLVLLSLTVVTAACAHEDCATELSVLEEALYQTGDNIFQLNQIFFPPSKRPSKFIRVTYTFLNASQTGGDDGCNVTYIWAIGGFLFFQPPSLFQFNSLFFYHRNNNLTDLYLKLPDKCRSLVQPNESTSLCSCTHNSKRLEILTQQLNIYAEFTNRDQITREHTFARAICAEELESVYYSGDNPSFVFVIVCSTIVPPILTLVLLVAGVRKMDENIANSFTRATSYGTIVAAIMTGTVFTVGILVANVLSCIKVLKENHEYSPFIAGYSINLHIVFGTLVCNILFALPLLFCIFYITLCFNARGILRRLCCNVVCSLHPCISRCITFIVGQHVFEKIEVFSTNSVISLMFPLMMATPILCISSHIGYILLAWLTEPSKCTAIFLLYYALIMYLFFAFKKLYNAHSGVKLSSNLSKKVKKVHAENRDQKAEGVEVELGAVANPEPTEEAFPTGENASSPDGSAQVSGNRIIGRSDGQHVNTQTFCLLMSYSFVIVGLAVIIILVFVLLPISSVNLVTYIFHLLQLVVVLVSTQFAYKLFFGSSFSLESVVSKFKEVYAQKGGNERLSAIARQRHEELSDVAGQFAAELTDVIIQS